MDTNHLHLVLDAICTFTKRTGKEPIKIIASQPFADKLETHKLGNRLYGFEFEIDKAQTYSLRLM